MLNETKVASSIENVKKGMLNISDPKELEIFEDCDHFYIDKEHIIADKVHDFFIPQKAVPM